MLMKKLILILSIFASTQSYAWGKLGHQITAKIAEVHLSETSKQQIKLILGDTNLVRISDWMDQIRPTKKYLKQHYTTMNNKFELIENKKSGLLYQSLLHAIAKIKQANASNAEKQLALKQIVHLVGDAHQPLHVGNGYDAGGNLCFVRWFKRKNLVSLHKIWDTFLVKATYHQNPWLVAETTELKPELIQKWQTTPILTWLQESRMLHQKIYPSSCKRSHPEHLRQNYVNQHMQLTKLRLEQGGIRLASILNQIFHK